MPDIQFPFWIVMRRQGILAAPVVRKGEPPRALAFTTATRAAAFLQHAGLVGWEFKMASPSTFAKLAQDLRRYGVGAICFDPDDSGGGVVLALGLMEVPAA